MQENIIKSPDCYDWSGIQNQERGFMKRWCAEHEFNFQTVYQVVYGLYRGGSGPRISKIIEAALKEDLIEEYEESKAA